MSYQYTQDYYDSRESPSRSYASSSLATNAYPVPSSGVHQHSQPPSLISTSTSAQQAFYPSRNEDDNVPYYAKSQAQRTAYNHSLSTSNRRYPDPSTSSSASTSSASHSVYTNNDYSSGFYKPTTSPAYAIAAAASSPPPPPGAYRPNPMPSLVAANPSTAPPPRPPLPPHQYSRNGQGSHSSTQFSQDYLNQLNALQIDEEPPRLPPLSTSHSATSFNTHDSGHLSSPMNASPTIHLDGQRDSFASNFFSMYGSSGATSPQDSPQASTSKELPSPVAPPPVNQYGEHRLSSPLQARSPTLYHHSQSAASFDTTSARPGFTYPNSSSDASTTTRSSSTSQRPSTAPIRVDELPPQTNSSWSPARLGSQRSPSESQARPGPFPITSAHHATSASADSPNPPRSGSLEYLRLTTSNSNEWERNGQPSRDEPPRTERAPSNPSTVLTNTSFSSSMLASNVVVENRFDGYTNSPSPTIRSPVLNSPTHPVFSSQPKRSMTGSSLSPFPSSSLSSPSLHHTASSSSTLATTPTPSNAQRTLLNLPEHLNPSLLSHLATFLKDSLPLSTHSKGSVEHSQTFTAQELITFIQRVVAETHPFSKDIDSRRLSISISRSLQENLWFHEIDFIDHPIRDVPSDKLYTFASSNSSSIGRDGEEEEEEVDVPMGVLTKLTRCYSPFCDQLEQEGSSVGCYAFDCPNRNKGDLKRQGSFVSSMTVNDSIEEPDNWVASVPPSVVSSMTKQEIAYQNKVFELIQGEVKFLNDLDIIETAFVHPLRTASPPIITPPSRLEPFLSSVLQNISSIREHSRLFVEALQEKQKLSHVVHGIGRIMLSAAVEWSPDYTKFTVALPLADWAFREERDSNPRFKEFLNQFQNRPEVHRHNFSHFHTRATFRAARLPLLIDEIIKSSQDDDPDKPYLIETLQVVKQQSAESDHLIAVTKCKVALREYDRDLVPKREGESLAYLELRNDDERKYFGSGKVLRRTEGTVNTEWNECWLILFDHYLVTSKMPREKEGRKRYPLLQRPVPLDLIQLKTTSFTDPPQQRSSGFHLRSARAGGTQTTPDLPSSSGSSTTLVYPIHFYQIGRYDGPVYYFVESQAVRSEWEQKIRSALDLRARRQSISQAVRLDVLADTTFGATHVVGSLDATTTNAVGRPTCSVPLDTADGQPLVVMGCAEGLFIGYRGRPKTLRQVVALSGITQCAVLPEYGFVLVLANKVLIAYSLEALIPSGSSNSGPVSKAPQRLSGQKDVSFFRVGNIGTDSPRTLVIYAKKGGVKESVFKALEPINQSKSGASGAGHRLFNFGSSKTEFFKSYKDFFIPALVTGLQFHRSKLALIGSRGVEIMDLEDMKTMTVPAFPSSRHDRSSAILAERCEKAQALGMFRLQGDRFLLAYNQFAFHVTRHGVPIEGFTIEWESKPESVAYCAPFIFAFSSTIVEIRHAMTGHLTQFITGSQISLIYDGSAISSATNTFKRSSDESSSRSPADKRLHFSQKVGNYHVVYEVDVEAGWQSNLGSDTPGLNGGSGFV